MEIEIKEYEKITRTSNYETVLDNGHSIWIIKIKQNFYLYFSGSIRKCYKSTNIYELIDFAIKTEDIYENVPSEDKEFWSSERIYLYKTAKYKGFLKDMKLKELKFNDIRDDQFNRMVGIEV